VTYTIDLVDFYNVGGELPRPGYNFLRNEFANSAIFLVTEGSSGRDDSYPFLLLFLIGRGGEKEKTEEETIFIFRFCLFSSY
jgi:hypothetical protein